MSNTTFNWLHSRGVLYVKATDVVTFLENCQSRCNEVKADREEQIIRGIKTDFSSAIINALNQLRR